MPAAKKSPKAIMDVAAPGAPGLDQAAAATSRSIIIKHQTVQDPMVNTNAQPEPAKPSEPESAPVLTSPSAKKLVIQPIHQTLDDGPTEKVEPPKVEPEPVAVAETAVEAPKRIVTEPQSEPEKVEAVVSERPVIDDQKVDDDRQDLVNKLVTSEKYFLPIHTAEERRSKRAIIIGSITIIILLLAWYNVSLDAGLLANTFNLPHTNFFTAR